MANKNKLMEKAQKLLQKGKLKETIATLDEVISVDPTDFRVLLKKGELESRIGDNESAKASYTQVAEQYSQDGFYLKAIAIYKKILKLDAEEFHIYSKLAFLYRKLGLDTEARKNLKVVAEYYKAKGLKTNYHEVAIQLSELGETVSDSQIEFVEKFAQDGDRDKAISQFRTMSEKYMEGGNLKQLDSIVKKMDELGLKDLDTFVIQARGYVNSKEPKKALQVIQKAYAMQPQNTTTLELLARCFLELKQPQKAASVFNELVKIYDRNGDMKNLSRVKADMLRVNDPSAVFEPVALPARQNDEVEEIEDVEGADQLNEDEDDDDQIYDTVQREESDEFIIEEVQIQEAKPKKAPASSPAPETHHRIDAKAAEINPPSFSDLEDALEDSIIVQEDEVAQGEDSFNRTGTQMPSEDSFMNVFVDAFDNNENTVMAKQPAKKPILTPPPAPKQEATGPKIEVPAGLDDMEADFSFGEQPKEESISFQGNSSFELIMQDVAEPTKIDIDENEIERPEKTMEASSDVFDISLEEESSENTTHDAPQKQELVGFDDFYSDGQKEKSEISVNEEEFVSISQFLDEGTKPKQAASPEKIEIHDRVVKPVTQIKHKANIEHQSLMNEPLSADIESTMDFSNLDLNEINLKIPGLEDSKAGISFVDEPSIASQDVMNTLLEDPEPEEAPSLANQINLDEKTMLDLKHEFHESTKVEKAPVDDSFFDLAGELKDEISEFEKSFGKMDEDAEEEFLSPEEVILEFKKGVARTIDKNDFQTHYNLGVAYKEMGLLDEAISAFELAATNPDSRIDAYSMIGICLANKNDYERAAKLYLQLLPTMNYQDPKYLGIMYQLGEAYMELGRHVDAYKAFAKVKDLDPNFRDAKSRAKELGFNLGMKDEVHTQQSGKIVVDMKERKKNKI